MLAHVATIDAESCVHIDNFRLCRVATSGGVAESQSDADLARCVVESRMKPFETAKKLFAPPNFLRLIMSAFS